LVKEKYARTVARPERRAGTGTGTGSDGGIRTTLGGVATVLTGSEYANEIGNPVLAPRLSAWCARLPFVMQMPPTEILRTQSLPDDAVVVVRGGEHSLDDANLPNPGYGPG
jgi:hypothetical protein